MTREKRLALIIVRAARINGGWKVMGSMVADADPEDIADVLRVSAQAGAMCAARKRGIDHR